MIKHVFFDLDHTLWDFEANAEKAYEICLNKHNIAINAKDFMRVYRPVNNAYWRKYREETVTKEQLVFGRLHESFTLLNHKVSDSVINEIALDFLKYLPTFNQLFEGAIELLEYLKPKYKLHIITNGFDEVQIPKLRNANILHYFDQIITADAVGVRKPNPKIFYYAFSKTGATSQNSMMIGDSIEADIEGASAVNMRSIHFDVSENQSNKEIVKVSSLIQIKKYL